MDPHQPAFWLDRPAAEAAEFLARTAVASRAVGGFVKQAVTWQDALNTAGRDPVLRNSLIGAGIGGLGGLGAGMMDRKRKNPLATALGGAALGGMAGLGGTLAYQNWPLAAKDPNAPPSPDEIAAKQQAQEAHDQALKADALPSIAGKLTGTAKQMAGVDLDPAEAVHAQKPWSKLVPHAVRDTPFIGSFATNPGRNLGIAAGTGAAQYGIDRALGRVQGYGQTYRNFQTGVKAPNQAGVDPALQPVHQQAFLDLSNQMQAKATPKGLGRVLPDWWNQARAGSQLSRMAEGRMAIPTVRPGAIDPAQLRSTIASGKPPVPSGLMAGAGRLSRGSARLGTHVGAQVLMNWLLGQHDSTPPDYNIPLPKTP